MSFRRFPLHRATAWACAVLAGTALAVACTRDGGTGPREDASGPARLTLRALVANDGEDRLVQIGVGYRRGDGEVRALATDPSSVAITSGTTRQEPVVVDLVPCFADAAREHGARDGCNLQIELRLTTLDGGLIAVSRAEVPDVIAGGTAVAPQVQLAAPTLAVSTPTLAFSGTTGFAAPAPLVVSATGSGSVPVGALSAAIAYGPGGADWLSTTIDQVAGAVTVTPTIGALAAGTYTATVTVAGSTPGVKPQSVTVTLTVQPVAVLTVSGAGSGAGRVTAAGVAPQAGIDCAIAAEQTSGACVGRYPADSAVTLTATPSAGNSFGGWSGGCSGTGTCTVRPSVAPAVTATFVAPPQTLTVNQGTGTGTGTVTSNVGGIDCTSSPNGNGSAGCSTTLPFGTAVTLTATPAAGSTFDGWTGDCSGTGPCTITLDAGKQAAAIFTLQTRTFSVLAGAGDGSGSVTSSPAGVNCTVAGSQASGSCTTTQTIGTVLTLTPVADQGSLFAGWSGACSGTGACVVTVAAAASVTATFVQATRTLTLTLTGDGAGSVTSSPAGISCFTSGSASASVICTGTFATGTAVTLTPTPSQGNRFGGFGGDCVSTGPCTLTLDRSASVTGDFRFVGTANINVFINGEGTIVFSPDGGQPPCVSTFSSASCTRTYDIGTQLTLTPEGAPADSAQGASTLTGWDAAECTAVGPCTFTVSASTSLAAVFRRPVRLDVSVVFGVGDASGGRVTSQPAGIDCNLANGDPNTGTCSAFFAPGTVVTLTGSGSVPGSQGRAFSDCDVGDHNGGPCTITMSFDRSVTMAIDGPQQLVVTEPDVSVPTGWQRQFDLASDQFFREIDLVPPTVTQTSGDGTWKLETQLVGARTQTQLLTRCVQQTGFSGQAATFQLDLASSNPGVPPVRLVITCDVSF